MAEGEIKTKTIAAKWSEQLFDSIDTPTELFFFALFVVGIITVSGTLLVGPCGNIDDTAKFNLEADRTANIKPGSTVITRTSVVVDNTLISPGVCAIIDEVDGEAGTAEIKVLAKAVPDFILNQSEYKPIDVFSGIFFQPVSTILFLNTPTPSGTVSLLQVSSVPTRPFTNILRDIYLNHIFVVMFILLILFAVLLYIGTKYKKARILWYQWHTLRSQYRARMMQDRAKMRSLKQKWIDTQALFASDETAQWKEGLLNIQNILDGVLILLQFEGEDLNKKLEKLTTEDLWMIEKLWNAYSINIRLLNPEEHKKSTPPVSKKVIEDIRVTYEDSFIWFGLLLHKPV